MVDECTPRAVIRFLEQMGHDAVSAPHPSTRLADEAVFEASSEEDRILITTDASQPPLYTAWLADGNHHPGILVGVQAKGIGELLADLRRTLEQLDPVNLRDSMMWLI